MTAGYSPNPLVRKLGIKEGYTVLTINAPSNYDELVAPLPPAVSVVTGEGGGDLDVIHLFTNRRDDLFRSLDESRRRIRQNGSIWVSWYKKASRLPTEITEDTIREAALPLGLVDVKVCAVDEKWSGLKLMIRKEFRS